MVDVRAALRDGRQHDRESANPVRSGPAIASRRPCSARACRAGRARSQPGCRSSEVVPEDLVVVALLHPLVPVEPEPVGEAVVVGRDEPALAGRHVLRAVEAERPVAEAPGSPSAVRSRRGPGRRPRRSAMPCRSAIAMIRSMSATRPNRCTGKIARVRGVIAASIRPASMRYVSGSMSTKTGGGARVEDRAHRRVERVTDRDDLVARPEAHAGEDAHPATVPLLTAMACFTPQNAAHRSSSSATRFPWAIIPVRRTSVTASISSWPISGRTCGIMHGLLEGRLIPRWNRLRDRVDTGGHSPGRRARPRDRDRAPAGRSPIRSRWPHAQTHPRRRAGLPATSA